MEYVLICLVFGLVCVIIIGMLLKRYRELEVKCQEYYMRYQASERFSEDLKKKLLQNNGNCSRGKHIKGNDNE